MAATPVTDPELVRLVKLREKLRTRYEERIDDGGSVVEAGPFKVQGFSLGALERSIAEVEWKITLRRIYLGGGSPLGGVIRYVIADDGNIYEGDVS